MAQLNIGQYNFNTIQTARVANVGEIYANIGHTLNQNYFRNRESFISNVANPLSQVKSRKDDEQLLQTIKADITDGLNEIAENDDWSQATPFIYNSVENLMTNNGLRAISDSYAKEQSYLQGLQESNWDSNNQVAFYRRSLENSSPIEYDANNNVVTNGGFNGVQHGNPFDEQKFQDDLADAVSKAKASGYTAGETLTNPNSELIRNLSVITGEDGRQIASHFVEMTTSSEGVSYDRIASYVYSRMQNNPDYVSHLNTVATNNWVNRRWVDDPLKPNGGYLRDFSNQDLIDSGLFADEALPTALAGHGLILSQIGTPRQDGSWIVNKHIPQEMQEKINLIENIYDIDLLQILSNPNSIGEFDADINSLQAFLNDGLNQEIDNIKNTYVQGNPNDWYQGVLNRDFVDKTIQSQVAGIANMYSWQKTSSISKLIDNSLYEYSLKSARNDIVQNGLTQLSFAGAVETNEGNVGQVLTDLNRIGDQIKTWELEANKYLPVEDDYQWLKQRSSSQTIDIGQESDILNFDIAKFIAENPQLDLNNTESDDYKRLNKIGTYQSLMSTINQEKANLKGNSQFIDKAFELWSENKTGEGWNILPSGSKIEEADMKFILDNNIKNYDQYIEILNNSTYNGYNKLISPNGKEYSIGGALTTSMTLGPLSEEKFNKKLSGAITRVMEAHNKTATDSEKLQLTAIRNVIKNPSIEGQIILNNAREEIKSGVGGWVVESSPTGKGVGKNAIDFAGMLTADTRQVTTNYSEDGIRVTTQSISQQNVKGIDASQLFGKKAKDVHYTEFNLLTDPLLASDTNGGLAAQISAYGRNGEFLGNVVVKQYNSPNSNDASSIHKQILQGTYNKIRSQIPAQGPNNDKTLEQSLGKIVATATETDMFTFNSNRNDPGYINATNVRDLQAKLSTLKPNEERRFIMQGHGLNGIPLDDFNREIVAKKEWNPYTQTYGFKLTDVTKNGVFGFESDIDPRTGRSLSGSSIQIPTLMSGSGRSTENIASTFYDLTQYIMDSNYFYSQGY